MLSRNRSQTCTAVGTCTRVGETNLASSQTSGCHCHAMIDRGCHGPAGPRPSGVLVREGHRGAPPAAAAPPPPPAKTRYIIRVYYTIKTDILHATSNIRFNDPKITLISTTLGKEMSSDEYTKNYWRNNIRQTVLFYQGMTELNYIDIFVEIGPHPVLKHYIKSIYPEAYLLNMITIYVSIAYNYNNFSRL
eukprot:SAG22_NODE_791_length_7210_cov_40.904936_2_plen_191_part_00